MRRLDSTFVLLTCAALLACSGQGADDAADANATDRPPVEGDTVEEEAPKVGFEILNIVSPDEIKVWINTEMTEADFDAIELPMDWFKNQPREGDPDDAYFARSPDATEDGVFTDQEHFGHTWRYNAKVIEMGIPMDDEGLLSATRVVKFHMVTFYAGRTLKVLVSPGGAHYVRISRDANRLTDHPTLPAGWTLVDYETPDELTFDLPNPTINIRADNEDSFQGPVPDLPIGAATEPQPLELTPDLCDDPGNMALLMDAFGGDEEPDNPTYGEINTDLMMELIMAPTEGPFYMVNLIKFNEKAIYPDGRESDLTGREANALYQPMEFLSAIGARVVYVGPVVGATAAGKDAWDEVAIVEYPCPLALLAMSAHPGFQARSIHKEAGLAASIVMVTHLQDKGDHEVPEPLFPASDGDPAFSWVRVLDARDEARYPEGSEEPEKSGQEALEAYAAGVSEAEIAHGIAPTARLHIQGVFIGDGRDFDAIWIDQVPSQATLDALAADPAVVAARVHYEAAVQDAYGLKVDALLSDFSGGTGGTEGPAPPVTADGTGTPCQTDEDCPGDGVDVCLSDGDSMGICTRQGCVAGDCEAPYVCCGDCSEMVAPMLPFEGSACVPEMAVPQFTAAPLSCTCE